MTAPAAASESPTDPVSRIQSIIEAADAPEEGRAEARGADGRYTERPGGGGEEIEPEEGGPEPAEAEAAEGAEEGAEAEAEEGAEAEAEEGAEEGVQTFDELAQALEIEADVLAEHITVQDAEGNPVPLSTVLTEYRNQPAATAALAEVRQQEAALETERTELRGRHDQELNKVVALTQQLINSLGTQEPDWARLKEDLDPDEYLARRQDYAQRDAAVRASLAELNQQAAGRDGEFEQERARITQREVEQLKVAMPAWRDPKKAEPAMAAVAEYLQGRGFQEAEVNTMIDHRMVLVAYDAVQYQRIKKQRPAALKRVQLAKDKSAGRKAVTVGARQPRVPKAAQREKQARARLKRTGKVEDAAAVFDALIDGED
jgi:hypothetical protein